MIHWWASSCSFWAFTVSLDILGFEKVTLLSQKLFICSAAELAQGLKKKYLCPLLWVWYHLVKFLMSHYFTVSIASLKLLTGYENVNICGKNRSYLVCQRQVCREGSFFRFPGGGTQFPQGVDRYIDQLASVIPLDNGTVRTAQGTGCGVYRIDLNVYIQPSLLMYEFHSSILASRVYQSYFHSSYNDVFLGLLA